MRRYRLSRMTTLNSLSIVMALVAAGLTYGYMQSSTETRWTRCIVDGAPHKGLISGAKKWASKRLFCENSTVVIALKKDHELPLTEDEVLEPDTAVACTYNVAKNLFHLFKDQIVTDSLECMSNASSDTG